jgi:SAM-dependent methyltransferase
MTPTHTPQHPHRIVQRIEHGEDRTEILATTYQMRNFYRQFGDGFFSRLDVFNYISHHQIARWAAKHAGARLLDVCCGRGLLLPLLRYHAKDLGSYTGLDIEPSNATWQTRRVTDNKPVEAESYYPFATEFVAGDVADADTLLTDRPAFDLIAYTASIEHMHPDHGERSLHALRRVIAPSGLMVLTAPNTPEDQDGYDTARRAHVYEWKLTELRSALSAAEWDVLDVWGLDIGVLTLSKLMTDANGRLLARLRKFIPPEWLGPLLAAPFPEESSEVGLLCMPA